MSKVPISRGSGQIKVATASLPAVYRKLYRRSKLSVEGSGPSRVGCVEVVVSMGPGSSSGLRRGGAKCLLDGFRALKTMALGSDTAVVAATKASKPTKPLNAYQLFQKDPAVQEQSKGLPLSERSKRTSALWKGLNAEQKSKFESEAEAGGLFKAKTKEKTGGPGKGYSAFVAQEYASIKEKGIPPNEIFKALGQKWKGLSEAEKDKYKK